MPHVDYIGSDGTKWPSATELTALLPKDFLWGWYQRAVQKDGWNGWLKCKAQSEEGKRLGTAVHAFLESLTLQKPSEEEEYKNCKEIAQAIFNKVDPMVDEYVKIEPHLISKELKIQGTADIIVRRVYDTGLWIGDYKTSYIKDDIGHPLQLAVYAFCWNEEHPDLIIDKGFIARVDKNSKKLNVAIDEYTDLKQYFPVIKALKVVYDHIHRNKKND